jgi:hypothetical protein
MGLYLVLAEFTFTKLIYVKWNMSKRSVFLWIFKYLTFNLMFIPILLFMPKLFYPGEINNGLLALLFLGGQVVLVIYDKAYEYFQKLIWSRVRSKLNL